MTGIVGIIGEKGSDGNLLGKMTGQITREGRFGIERYDSNGIGLVNIHLSKFPKEGRAGPHVKDDVMVMVHGKIYRDEAEDVEIEDDATYCSESFLKKGIKFVEGLNGNFLLVIHDRPAKTTYLVNDRFGFRPHYYSLRDGTLYVAPEPKAIVSVTEGNEISRDSVVEFFARGEFWGGRTWFSDINILGPATILTFKDGEIRTEQYWQMKYQTDPSLSDDRAVDLLADAFKKAVTTRFAPGLRVGTSLSGGMDSRTVIAAMRPEQRENVTSLTFGPDDCGEVGIARKVAKKAGIKKHVVMDISPDMVLDNAAMDVDLTDGRLFMGMAFVHPIFDELSADVDVLLDGFAMDLTLGGGYLNDDIVRGTSVQALKDRARGKRLFTDDELALLLKDDKLDERLKWLNGTVDEEFSKLRSEDLANMWDEFAMKTHVAWMHIGDVALLQKLEVAHPSSDNRFYELLMKIPPEKRVHHAMSRKLLMALDRGLADVKYDNTGCRPSASLAYWDISYRFIGLVESAKRRLNQMSHGQLYFAPRKSYVNYDEWFSSSTRWREFFEAVLLDESDGSGQYLNHEFIKKLIIEEYGGKGNAKKLLHIATFKLFLKAALKRQRQSEQAAVGLS